MSSTRELKLFQSWRDNPEKFVRECIGAIPSNQQVEGLRLVGEMGRAKIKSFDGERLTEREQSLARKIGISIRSGHGTGKDTWLSWVYLWLNACFPFSRGMVTAPTSHQLRQILWGEFSKWVRKSEILSDAIAVETELVYNKDHKKEWFISARTTNPRSSEDEQAETLAGMHEKYMILAVDESSGVPKPVFKPLEGALTGMMNFAILIGNPTRATGYFAECFGSDKAMWECLTWNSEESTIVSRDYIDRMAYKYGRDSNMYRIRVLGLPPISESNTLIPYEWVQNAVDRELEVIEGTYKLKGIDVGSGGDKTVILTRQGNKVTDIAEYDNSDTMKVTGWLMGQLADDDYDMAFIDPIGIGAGVYDRLIELRVDNLYPVDVRGESSNVSCFRTRDDIFWRLREQFEKGIIQIPDDEELMGELSTIRYDVMDSKGMIKVESKKDMRKRGLASPNKADALALTFYFSDSTYKSIGKPIGKSDRSQPVSWRVG